MKIARLLIFCLSFLEWSCQSQSDAPETITISGITQRNQFGSPIGTADNDDWTTESSWPTLVSSQFNFSDTLNYAVNNEVGTINLISAYPNPATSQFIFIVSSSKPTIMKCILVDKQVNVLRKGTFRLESPNFAAAFDFTDPQIIAGKTYRLYYAFYDKNKAIYAKGHGDIEKK